MRLIVVVCILDPDVPVMVTVYVPVAGTGLAATFIVDVQVPPLIVVGVNVTFTPAGKPDADKVTGEANPLLGVTVIVERAAPPPDTVSEEGEALRLKLPPVGVLVTVRATLVVCVMPPPVPVTVIV